MNSTRILTNQEIQARGLHPNSSLVKPNKKYKQSYLNAIDNGYIDIFRDTRELLEDDNNFDEHINKLNSGFTGDKLCTSQTWWLIDEDKFIGRSRLKNIELPENSEKWNHPTIRAQGHIGYKINPAEFGNKYGTLLLSYSIDEVIKQGLSYIHYAIDLDGIRSQNTTLSCGFSKGESFLAIDNETTYIEFTLNPFK